MSVSICIRVGIAIFTAWSVVQSVVAVLKDAKLIENLEIGLFVGCVAICAVAIFLVNGLLLEGYLKNRATIELKDIGASVCVTRGDLLAQNGVVVVADNDFFDTAVDEEHVSPDSIHGCVVKRYWKDSVSNLNAQIERQLQGVPCELVPRDGVAKEKRYKIGTSVFVKSPSGKRFILVALTRTNAATHWTQAMLADLRVAIRGHCVWRVNMQMAMRFLLR